MTNVKSLNLSIEEKGIIIEKIKERVVAPFNLAANYETLTAKEVTNLLLSDVNAKNTDDKVKQFTVNVMNHEGLDGQIVYSELNDEQYAYTVANKTQQTQLLPQLAAIVEKDAVFNQVVEKINEQYTIHKNEAFIIHDERVILTKEHQVEEKLVKDLFTYPVYHNNEQVGVVMYDNQSRETIALIGQEQYFHLNGEIVTIQANSCSLTWAECMQQELGCSNWSACLVLGTGCFGSCCGCAGVFTCVACAGCAFHVLRSAWTCRMCVPGAARPHECPTK